MEFKRLTPEEMDKEGELAGLALRDVRPEAIEAVSEWWRVHYLKVGHRALGRLVMDGRADSGQGSGAESDVDLNAAQRTLTVLRRSAPSSVTDVLTWYREWYLKAGHKRLGRLLCNGQTPTPAHDGAKVCHVTPGDHFSNGKASDAAIRRNTIPADEGRLDRISVVDVTCNVRYQFKAATLDTPALFSVQPSAGVTVIAVNTNHPAGEAAFEALSSAAEGKLSRDDSGPGIPSLFLLAIESWAHLESETPPGKRQETVKKVREDWGRTLRDMFLRQLAAPVR